MSATKGLPSPELVRPCRPRRYDSPTARWRRVDLKPDAAIAFERQLRPDNEVAATRRSYHVRRTAIVLGILDTTGVSTARIAADPKAPTEPRKALHVAAPGNRVQSNAAKN